MLVSLSDKKKPFTWKFLAPGHGIGVVVGIGGTFRSMITTDCNTREIRLASNFIQMK